LVPLPLLLLLLLLQVSAAAAAGAQGSAAGAAGAACTAATNKGLLAVGLALAQLPEAEQQQHTRALLAAVASLVPQLTEKQLHRKVVADPAKALCGNRDARQRLMQELGGTQGAAAGGAGAAGCRGGRGAVAAALRCVEPCQA
jgi:hypothetical protein